MPEAARPIIRRHLRDNAIEIALQLRQIRQARQYVAEVVGRPTLDDKALADAFAQLRARTTALQELIHKTLAQAIEEMPADVRRNGRRAGAAAALVSAALRISADARHR